MKRSEKKQARELEKKAIELEKRLLEKQSLEEQAQKIKNNFDGDEVKAEDEELFEQYDEGKLDDAKTDRRSDGESHNRSIKVEDMLDYCDFIESTVKKINTNTARVAGSWGEKRGARMLRELSQDALNAPSRLEPFDSRMLRGRGSFVVLGAWYAVCLVLYLLSFIPRGVGGVVMTAVVCLMFMLGVAAIISLLLGFSWFEKIYPKKISYNVVSELNCKVEAKRTLIVSCNYDSPLGNNFKTKIHIMPKVLLGAVFSTVLFVIFCIIKMSIAPHTVTQIAVLIVLPFVICAIAVVALVAYVSLSKNKVKENNGLGVATTLTALKYLNDNRLISEDCRVVFVAFAAENAGHGGAEEFVALHGQDKDFFVNPMAVNFGDIKDDKITVVTKDILHAQIYDESLAESSIEAIKQKDIAVERYDGNFNCLCGFSSTPFAKAGIPAITMVSKDMSINPLNAKRDEKTDRSVIENSFKTAVTLLEKLSGEQADEQQRE